MLRIFIIILIVLFSYPLIRGDVSISPLTEIGRNVSSLRVEEVTQAGKVIFNGVSAYYKNMVFRWGRGIFLKSQGEAKESVIQYSQETTRDLVSDFRDFVGDIWDRLIKLIPLRENEPPTGGTPISLRENEPPYDMPVLVLSYFPLKDGKLNPEITGMDSELAEVRSTTKDLVRGVLSLFTKASIYHGYKDSRAKPSLSFRIFEEKEFLKALPAGLEVPWKKGEGVYRPDYNKILSDMDICDYVDNKGVNWVFVIGYHYGSIEPVESNMSMGKLSKAFWNFDGYGDISNSEQTDDLPTCERTYVLQNIIYSRGVGMESYGHHLESVFRWIDYDLFWNKFVGPFGSQLGDRRCGWMHYTPNAVSDGEDYDFRSERKALSDCQDWKPDGTGQKTLLNCLDWYAPYASPSEEKCEGDTEGFAFQLWWTQNIPGWNNSLEYQGKKMRNWWEFVGDLDDALQRGKSFTYN